MTSAEELYAVAKASLPGWFFETKEASQLLAAAELLGKVLDHVKSRVSNTYILQSSDEWIEEHAADRGTRRQAGEDSDALADRLRNAEDAVTPDALVSAANRILQLAGITESAAVSELRKGSRMFFSRSRGWSRGWRFGLSHPGGNKLIVILPYGTSAGTAAAIAEALRLRKAGGVGFVIEIRGVP